MAGKNKQSTKKQTLLLSSQSAETSMASSQMVPSIELNAMGIGESVPRDGKGEYAAFEGKANGFPNLGHQLQSLKIGVDFSGLAKYLSNNAPDTPPFSPQMSSKSGLPSTIPLLEAPKLYSHNRAYHKNTASTQSSVSTPGSYSYASSPAAPRTWIIYRHDKSKKNVIITASGIKHNITEMQSFIHVDGSRVQFETDKYKEGHYEFLADVSSMSAPEKAKFWARNVVEVNIDIKALDYALDPNWPTILTQMDKIDESFYQHVEQIHINLDYPTPQASAGTAIVQNGGRPAPLPFLKDSPPIEVDTPAMLLLTRLVCRLTKLKSLTQLAVTMRTPLTSGTSITAEQLNYVVPFMILEDWSLYWQAVYLSTPQFIPHKSWATRYLGEQWFKVHGNFKELWVEVRREYDAEFTGRVRGLDWKEKRRAWD